MGISATFWKGMIFGKVHDLFANLNENIQSPLYACVVCMTPYYGSALYWAIWGVGVKEWLVVVFAGMGLNAIFVRLFQPFKEEE